MGNGLIATSSIPVLEGPERDAPLVTELVAGERLEVLEGRGDWLRVVAPGHATGLDPRGYPGWVRPGALVEAPGWDPDLSVVAPNGAGLPLGARLRREGEGVSTPDGGAAALEPDTVKPVSKPVQASPAELCRGLLGLPYRWGGTDSTTGMDSPGWSSALWGCSASPYPATPTTSSPGRLLGAARVGRGPGGTT